MPKSAKTTKEKEVSQFEVPDSQIMFDCLFNRLLQNEEVSKNIDISSKETDSNEFTPNDPSVNNSINIKRSTN